jgi:type III secretion protein W
LFQELSNKYAYKDLKKIIDFMLHSLGADLKSGGPSIAPGLLHRLISETRNMQAILGVYRFFRNRMRLVEKSFGEQNISMPKELSFESMAKVFMGLAEDRYPTASKVHQTTSQLGIANAPLAKSVVYSQMRDGVREVARDLVFTTVQHRDELWNAIVEFLMDVEDQLESMAESESPNDQQIDKLIKGSDEEIRPKGDNDEVVT